MKQYNFVQEGWKLRHSPISLIGGSAAPGAMNDERTSAFTAKIIQKYPNGVALSGAFKKLAELHPKRAKKLLKMGISVSDLEGEDYFEYVRTHLAGNSGFWKNILYTITLPVSYWYKLFSVDKDLKANYDPDEIIDRFSKNKTFFR